MAVLKFPAISPDKFTVPCTKYMRSQWRDIANWQEKALSRQRSKVLDQLSEPMKDLLDLAVGDSVLIQNKLGNNPRRWEKRGTVVETLPHQQYRVMLDGSRRVMLRNRKFLRKYQPLMISDGARLPMERLPCSPGVTSNHGSHARHDCDDG